MNSIFVASGLTAALGLLAGCSSSTDSGGPNAVNPAVRVDLALNDFVVDDHLDWTVYRGFLQAIPPADETDLQYEAQKEIVADVGRVSQNFIHWQGPTATDYVSVENAVDLMQALLYTDQVANFRDGRAYIGSAIDAGTPAIYRNDQVTFRTGTGENERTWQYILYYAYVVSAEGDEDQVADAVNNASGDEVVREIDNAVVRVIEPLDVPGSQVAIFPALNFKTMGEQTTPEAVITTFTLPADNDADTVDPTATLNQSWIGKQDLWTWTSEEAETFGDQDNVRCAHLRVDYASYMAYFYTSAAPSRVGQPDATEEEQNLRCGAVDENGNYRTAAEIERINTDDAADGTDDIPDMSYIEWSIDSTNSPSRH